MTVSAMVRIYCARLGRREMRVSEVPARWRSQVEDVFDVSGHPKKSVLLEKCALLGIEADESMTNPEIAALIVALYEEVK